MQKMPEEMFNQLMALMRDIADQSHGSAGWLQSEKSKMLRDAFKAHWVERPISEQGER